MSRISKLKKFLTRVQEMEDAEIKIPENLLQAIDSLAEQLEPFLEDSPQKAELDALGRHESIKDIYCSLWKIFYDDLYQGILLEHEKFRKIIGDALFEKSHSESVRKEDISTRLTQIHTMLIAQWKSPISPPIEQIYLPPSLITSEMLYSYITDGQHYGENPEYGYQEEPSLTQDARPLSFEEYVEYQTGKLDDICDWIRKCDEFTTNEKSYNFIYSPQSDITLGEEAMKMYGSMTYEDIFTLLNKEYGEISEHFWVRCTSNDDDN